MFDRGDVSADRHMVAVDTERPRAAGHRRSLRRRSEYEQDAVFPPLHEEGFHGNLQIELLRPADRTIRHIARVSVHGNESCVRTRRAVV